MNMAKTCYMKTRSIFWGNLITLLTVVCFLIAITYCLINKTFSIFILQLIVASFFATWSSLTITSLFRWKGNVIVQWCIGIITTLLIIGLFLFKIKAEWLSYFMIAFTISNLMGFISLPSQRISKWIGFVFLSIAASLICWALIQQLFSILHFILCVSTIIVGTISLFFTKFNLSR